MARPNLSMRPLYICMYMYVSVLEAGYEGSFAGKICACMRARYLTFACTSPSHYLVDWMSDWLTSACVSLSIGGQKYSSLILGLLGAGKGEPGINCMCMCLISSDPEENCLYTWPSISEVFQQKIEKHTKDVYRWRFFKLQVSCFNVGKAYCMYMCMYVGLISCFSQLTEVSDEWLSQQMGAQWEPA